MPTFDPSFWAGHEGQSYNSQTGTWNPVGSVQRSPSIADYQARQQQVEDARNAFHAAHPGATTMSTGQLYGVGAPNDYGGAYVKPNMQSFGNTTDNNAANQQWAQWDQNFANNHNVSLPQGYTPGANGTFNPGGGPVNGGSLLPGMNDGMQGIGDFEMNQAGGQNIGTGGQFGQFGKTTIGNLAGGMQMPGGQPNYPLDVGSYLNPMLGYGLQQGMQTINNSAAARGSLNSGDTLKELFGYGMGQGMDSFNKAAGIGQQQQGFAHNVDMNDRDFNYRSQVGDRDFAYRAATGDRDFNFQRALGQSQLGLQATGQQNAAAIAQAQLLAQLGMGGAQAASGGAIGQGNTVNDAISRFLSTYFGAQRAGG